MGEGQGVWLHTTGMWRHAGVGAVCILILMRVAMYICTMLYVVDMHAQLGKNADEQVEMIKDCLRSMI